MSASAPGAGSFFQRTGSAERRSRRLDRKRREKATDQRDEKPADDLAIALDGAEADPLQAARRGDREDDIGRDRARGEKYAHQCKQADTIAGSGKKRRDAFDHRRGAEQQKQRRAAGRPVAMLMEGRSRVGVDGNHMRGCGGVVVPMEMG